MNKIKNISDELLFSRLEEINGEFQDMHISAYKSDLLIKEKEDIRKELLNRGYTKT